MRDPGESLPSADGSRYHQHATRQAAIGAERFERSFLAPNDSEDKRVSQDKLQIAFSYHQQGHLEKAQELYQELLDLNPDHFDLLHLLGLVAYQQSHLERADLFFVKAMMINFFHAPLHLNRGVALMAAERFEEGLRSFEWSILIQPDFPDAYYNLGVAQQRLKFFDSALANYDCALLLQPIYVDACNNRGNVLHDLNRPSEALASFERAIAIDPDRADLYFNSGTSLKMIGNLEGSLAKINRALILKSDYYAALNNSGVILNQLSFFKEALECFEAAITLEPENGAAYHHQGLVLTQLNRFCDALVAQERAIWINPRSAETFYHQGNTFQQLKMHDEARNAFEKSISCKSDFAEAYNGLGVTMQELQKSKDALIHFNKAIFIKSDFAEAYNNRGVSLKTLKRFDEAKASYEKAILIKPDYSEAYYNYGLAQQELKNFGLAQRAYEKSILVNPLTIDAYNNLGALFKEIHCFNEARLNFLKVLELKVGKENMTEEIERWFSDFISLDFQPANFESQQDLEKFLQHLESKIDRCLQHFEIIRKSTEILQPVIDQFLFNMNGFYIAYLQENVVDLMLKYSCLMSQTLGINNTKIQRRSDRSGKIRLGLASGLLKSHNGTNWAYNWLAYLPDEYEIFTYAFNTDSDWLTEKFSSLGTHRLLRFDKDSFRRSIEVMQNDELDLLMLPDVGMTSASRILSLHRVAPVQFTAWGHPITTGSQNIDFFLSADLMEAEDAQSHYSEHLVRVPNLGLYLTTPQPLQIAERTFHFPEGTTRFGCLQSLFKYLPKYDFILPLIAKQVPNSLFVFLEGIPHYSTKILENRLRQLFRSHEIDYERHVQFLSRVSEREYMSLLAQMDVVLDSIGWTGGNTSLQAFELGKPIVTLPGQFMRGRHTYAMFRMMGLDQYVATSLEDYIHKAVEFGTNHEARRRFETDVRLRKLLLYEDRVFITGLDSFLKSAANHSMNTTS